LRGRFHYCFLYLQPSQPVGKAAQVARHGGKSPGPSVPTSVRQVAPQQLL
jgi:hypothetical protein